VAAIAFTSNSIYVLSVPFSQRLTHLTFVIQ